MWELQIAEEDPKLVGFRFEVQFFLTYHRICGLDRTSRRFFGKSWSMGEEYGGVSGVLRTDGLSRDQDSFKRGLQDLPVGCALAKDGLTTLPPGPEGTLVGKVRKG